MSPCLGSLEAYYLRILPSPLASEGNVSKDSWLAEVGRSLLLPTCTSSRASFTHTITFFKFRPPLPSIFHKDPRISRGSKVIESSQDDAIALPAPISPSGIEGS